MTALAERRDTTPHPRIAPVVTPVAGSPARARSGALTRRTMALGSGATAAVVATACAPSGATSGGGSSAAKTPVKLLYMSGHVSGSVGYVKDEEQFRLFSQQHPHITIELSPAPGAQVKEKLIVQATGGTPIQLTQNAWGLWMDLARGGMIRELGSFFKADKLSPEALFLPVAADFHSYKGVMYGFPISVSSDQIPFSKDLFQRESIPFPPEDRHDRSWTME